MKTFLTGNRDADRVILTRLKNHKELLSFCNGSRYGKSVCNNDFFRNYLAKHYPLVYQYGQEKETKNWKRFYLETVKAISLLQQKYNVIYTNDFYVLPQTLYEHLNIVKNIGGYHRHPVYKFTPYIYDTYDPLLARFMFDWVMQYVTTMPDRGYVLFHGLEQFIESDKSERVRKFPVILEILRLTKEKLGADYQPFIEEFIEKLDEEVFENPAVRKEFGEYIKEIRKI